MEHQWQKGKYKKPRADATDDEDDEDVGLWIHNKRFRTHPISTDSSEPLHTETPLKELSPRLLHLLQVSP
ncbi:unnamed protein product [Lota lota]